MAMRTSRQEHDLYRKIKWLIFFRSLFAALLLGSVGLAMTGPQSSLFLAGESLFYLFILAVGLLVFSLVYSFVLVKTKRFATFAYVQVAIDTGFVTLFIFVTGSFSSIFTFLYLVVIIYATMVIYRRGGMIVASICVLQYGIMINLEYYHLIKPIGVAAGEMISSYSGAYVLFQLMITIAACYSVAFLSGFLSEQEKLAKQELWAMENQMKRVERLAAVGEMAAGLTHEIKNPLASLTGSIQMLRESIAYDRGHDKLMQIVLREADRLSSLVTSFLMFSRPQAGKLQTVKIEHAIDQVVSLFRKDPVFQNRVDIRISCDATHYMQIDPEHLSQIIWNLLKNAAEAINGRGIIDISIVSERKGYVRITVEDNGAGISAENIESIFDPFFSTKARGTGLGLSIVQQIAGLYGILIDIQSAPGQGTCVILKFKRAPLPRNPYSVVPIKV